MNKLQKKIGFYVRESSNEKGVVLVMALVVLVILTLLGTLSTQIANNEVMTSGNQEGYLVTFYMIEGVGIEGISRLEFQNNTGNDCSATIPIDCRVKELYNPDTTALPWLDETFSGTSATAYDLTVTGSTNLPSGPMPIPLAYPNNWLNAKTSAVVNTLQQPNVFALEPSGYDEAAPASDLIRYAVQDNGRTGSYSIGSSDPEIHGYKIYGLYDVNRGAGKTFPGRSVVEMGYRMELETMDIL